MESIVKMGVSGKNARKRENQRGAASGMSGAPGMPDGNEVPGRSGRSGREAGNYSDYPGSPDGRAGRTFSGSPETGDTDKWSAAGMAAGAASGNLPGAGTGAGQKTAQELMREAEQERLAEQERALQKKRAGQYGLIARYVVITVVICAILLRLTENLGPILAAIGRAARMVAILLMPLFWGFVLAYILAPAVDFFEKKLRRSGRMAGKRGSRRGSAVAVTCILTLMAVVAVFSVVVSAVSRSLKVASLEDMVGMVQSFAGLLGSFQQMIMNRLEGLNISSSEVSAALGQIGEKVALFTKGLSVSLTGAVSHIGGFMTSLIFAVIFAVYFLLDGKGLMRYWNRVLLAVGGKRARRNFHILAKDADAVFAGYIRGQLMDAFIMAVLVGGFLSLVGVKYAVIIGVLSGIGNLIPYVGPVIAYGSTILVCLLTWDLRRLLVALVVLFVIQTLDGNIINPRLLSSSIDVHPMLVIAALIIGGAVGGVVGMLFAVPVAAFLKIQFDKVIDGLLRMRGDSAAGKPKRRRRSGSESAKRTAETAKTAKTAKTIKTAKTTKAAKTIKTAKTTKAAKTIKTAKTTKTMEAKKKQTVAKEEA